MKNVLVLYNGQSMFTLTVREFVESFGKYSRHNVHYLHVDKNTRPDFSLDRYDVLVLTYSCRLCYLDLIMSPEVQSRITAFKGLKCAFAQDEYQETNKLRAAVRELRLDLLFTCVPDDKIAWVYPPQTVPGVRFVRVLTGYVPDRYCHLPREELPAMRERPNWIGYRGRNLGHCWGDLSYYKVEIGRRFKSACARRGIPHDIAWTEDARVYQEQWLAFISSCRTTLGVPSGCNVFDWDGALEREYKELIKAQPGLTYEEYRPRIAHKEREIDMGQIAPRAFEAVALGTVLVLLEGSYSGVLTPDVDYIEVKKDFSNLSDVLDRIGDVGYLENMARRTYDHVIASRQWSYDAFVSRIDSEIEASLRATRRDGTGAWGVHLSPLKPYDQGVLEDYGLKAVAQYPLSRCLDLSHLRQAAEDHQALTDNLLAELSPTPAVNPHGELTVRIAALGSQVAALAAETTALAAFVNAQAAQASVMRAPGMGKFAQFRARGWARLRRVWQRLVQGTRHRLKKLLILLLGRKRCLRARSLVRGSPAEPQNVTRAAA